MWPVVEEDEVAVVEVKAAGPIGDQSGLIAGIAAEIREIKEVLMELVDVQREFLLAQEEVRRETVYLQSQLAGAVVVMMEGIAYVQDPEQDARDYDQWVEETRGEIL